MSRFGVERRDGFPVFDTSRDLAAPCFLADHPGAGFCHIADHSLHRFVWTRWSGIRRGAALIFREAGTVIAEEMRLCDLRRPVDEVGVPPAVQVDDGESETPRLLLLFPSLVNGADAPNQCSRQSHRSPAEHQID